MEAETPQAHAACDAPQRAGHHEAVAARPSGTALQEGRHTRTASAGGVPHTPGWQGGAGPLALLGGLTLGEALRVYRPVGGTAVCAGASIPTWLATLGEGWQGLDDGAHRDRLGHVLALG